MKIKLLLILFIIILILLPRIIFGRDYYVSTLGNDANTGTITSPFKNWKRLSDIMVAGDVAYIRGGLYYAPNGNLSDIQCYWQNLHGNSSNYITIQNYPGEVPILTCSNIVPVNPNNDPNIVYIKNCSFVHFKGLQITFLRQVSTGAGISRGWNLDNSPNCIMELIEVSRVGGGGFNVYDNSNDLLFLNCSSHNNADPFSGGGPGAYGNADGFDVTGGVNSTRTTFTGCSSFYNSDDGWDNFNTTGLRTWNGCMAWGNGYFKDTTGVVIPAGDGNGFKLGPLNNSGCGTDQLTILRFLNNCVSFDNRLNGFDQNGQPTMLYQLYNCTSYKNGSDGFEFQYSCSSPNTLAQTFKNNIAYLNGGQTLRFTGPMTNVSNNSWMPGYTVSAADFQSLDSTGVSGARDSITGALPYLPFLRLNTGSDLAYTGVNVGLPFCGILPCLGAYDLCTALKATCGANPTITLPVTTANISGVGSGGLVPYTYKWRQITGGSSTITNNAVANTSVTNLIVAGSYTYEFQVTDNNGAIAKDTISVTVNAAAATPPTCSAGTTPVTITLPTTLVALNGSGASTAGNTVSYTWGFTLGSGTIANANQAVTTATITSSGSYVISLLVVDNGNGLTCTSNKNITVNPQPVVPTANAGTDQILTLPTNSTSLTGSGSGGTITGYLWTIIQGIGGTLGTPTAATTTLTGLVAGVYKIQLRVTNNFSNTGLDTVQVTVNPAPAFPSCSAGSSPVNVQLPTNFVALTATGNSNSGNTVSFQWTQFSGTTVTINNANTANATAIGLTVGSYGFQVTVTDNGNGLQCNSTKTVNVLAAPVFPPVVTVAPASQTITLPTNIVSLTSTSTTPQGTITAKNWTQTFGTTATISSPTANNTFITNLTTAGIRRFKFCATNNDGLTSCDSLSVTVNPAIVPTAVCAGNITIALPVNFCTLSGIGTGAIPLSYTWTNLGASNGTIVTPNATSTQYTGLTAWVDSIEYKVTDANLNVAKDTIYVTIVPQPILPPVVTCAGTVNIALPTTVATISATAIASAGTITGIQWIQLSGASSTITSPTSLSTTVTGLATGSYSYKLVATQTNGLKDSCTILVTVSSTVTGNGIKYLQAYYYPDNSGRGDVGWVFDYSKYPRCLYMVGQIKLNGVFQDFGANLIPTLKNQDYYTFFNIKSQPKGTYFFRIKQQDSNGVSYSKEVSVKKK